MAGGGWEKIDVNYCWTLQTPATRSEVWLGTEDTSKEGWGDIMKSGQKMLITSQLYEPWEPFLQAVLNCSIRGSVGCGE